MHTSESLFWDKTTRDYAELAIGERDSETLVAVLSSRIVGVLPRIHASQSEGLVIEISEQIGEILMVHHGVNVDIDNMLEAMEGVKRAFRTAFLTKSTLGLSRALESQLVGFFQSIKVPGEGEKEKKPPVAVVPPSDNPDKSRMSIVSSSREAPLVKKQKNHFKIDKPEKEEKPERESEGRNTGGFDGPSKVYLRQISKFGLITPERERELAEIMRTGKPLARDAARDEMICANLRLVVYIAKDYANFGLSFDDLISEGNIGLMKSVERFDPDKGGKLSTYAAWWIKQSIKRALANQSKTIRVPVHQNDKIGKMKRVAFSMSEELGREPTDDELAAEIGIEAAKIGEMRAMSVRPASLDAEIGEDGGTTLGDMVGDGKADAAELLASADLLEKVVPLLKYLDKRERDIIERRFGIGRDGIQTLEEVGKLYGVTRERIRQLQNIALEKLRRAFMKQNKNLDTKALKKTASTAAVGIPSLRTPKPPVFDVKPASTPVALNGVGKVMGEGGIRSMIRALYLGTSAPNTYNLDGVAFELELPRGDIKATLRDMQVPLRQEDI